MPNQGDLVLIPIPFTDLSSSKRRPVIVVSHDRYNATSPDLVVVAMTSNPQQSDHSFVLTSADLAQGSLNRPGTVRVDKIYTLAQTLIVKQFGRLRPEALDRIRERFQRLISRSPPQP